MMPKRFTGAGVAIITPFTQTGEVDYPALDALVQMHLDCGTDFLCVHGTTGETPTLTIEEKRETRKRIIKQVNGRIPIMLGVGGNNTMAVVNELKTEDLTGIDAILSIVPYYNKPTQEGMYCHFKAIAEATELPIYLYNVPGRTGVNMLPETTVRLARECKNIVGLKAASGNLQQISRLIDIKPADFDVLSGDDALTVDIMKMGGVGVISVFSNAFPSQLVELVRAMEKGDVEKARLLNDKYTEIFRLLFVDGNPAGAKIALNIMGKCENVLRLPLVPVSSSVAAEMAQAIKALQ
ncbi:MAG: 4-hydroxy-tetrahydrodipicolinate synthase [Bacteroidaceae bacterium]|nr:4-hydroxy-tetrahydrodipicolinate synthase [Bacteroidaceae bacterium]